MGVYDLELETAENQFCKSVALKFRLRRNLTRSTAYPLFRSYFIF